MNDVEAHVKRPVYSFNVFDLIILLAIVAVLTYLAWSVFFGAVGGDRVRIEYKLEFEDLPEAIADAQPAKGDAVADSGLESALGVIESVSVLPQQEYVYDQAVEAFTLSDVPGRCRIVLTISAVASLRDGRYFVGDTAICAGADIDICSRGFSGHGRCISVTAAG